MRPVALALDVQTENRSHSLIDQTFQDQLSHKKDPQSMIWIVDL